MNFKEKFMEYELQKKIFQEGGSKTDDLTTIPINCPDKRVLNSFQLNTNGGLRYNYECLDNITDNNLINEKTNSNDYGNGKNIYLDRHAVDCTHIPGGYAINSFQLNKTDNTINYNYKCAKTGKILNKTYYTDYNDRGGNYESEYLERHNVKCLPNEELSSFKLEHNNTNKTVRYKYTCNSVFNIPQLPASIQLSLTAENKKDLSTNPIYNYGCFRPINGSTTLVVYFSPAGRKQLDGINVAIKFNCNLLLFSDKNENWYIDNSELIKAEINRIIQTNNITQIIMWGYSMGAYAAIKFATYFDCICIAFAPQTFNKKKNIFLNNDVIYNSLPIIDDIRSLIIASQKKIKIYAFYAKDDCSDNSLGTTWPELLHAGYISNLDNVVLIFLNYQTHFIYDKYNLINFFNFILENYVLLDTNIVEGGQLININMNRFRNP